MFCGFMTSCQVRINFFQGNKDASRLRAVISAGYPDLPQGFPSPGHPSNASVRRHPGGILVICPSQLIPFNLEWQLLYSDLPLNNQAPTSSLSETPDTVQSKFNSYYFTHDVCNNVIKLRSLLSCATFFFFKHYRPVQRSNRRRGCTEPSVSLTCDSLET